MSRPVALVTGPTSGIGRQFALQLADRGYDLVLVSRDRGRLDALAAEVADRYAVAAEVLVADLADRAALSEVERRVAVTEHPVDLLVNNAGFTLRGKFLDNDVEQEQAMLDVLVTAVLRLSHAACGQMVARGHGGVINVSSVAGYLPRGTYSAAKAYVTSLSRWADLTYREKGVRTMALCPGFTRTEFHQRIGVSRGSAPSWLWLDADRVVAAALADFDRGRRVSVPSKRYTLLAGLARAVPDGVQARLRGLGR